MINQKYLLQPILELHLLLGPIDTKTTRARAVRARGTTKQHLCRYELVGSRLVSMWINGLECVGALMDGCMDGWVDG